ncbi:peptidylprolyl isomerase [Pedobacter hartonius]|uniref:peptidylprolyl isomerase n=1 Tax=Pedobacter hartonius TaxID=425514 RepID=A0A1H4BG78_9SPHI|nr:peptidylprolyl isomerase [Pedobacter hartonius]SEA47130.1 peptidyl-prolyl cis-trans isomerase B (cyclophilin B) [Pedobacter hartonius]
MKTFILIPLLLLVISVAEAQTNYVQISTAKGKITLMLYDETPKHRDNFLMAIKTGLFNGAGFNRVIKGFVSQAGELDKTILDREKLHPEVPLQRVEAEIRPDLYHKKGALGQGRNDNPEKKSYLDQIYLVEGKKRTAAELDRIETKTGRKFSAVQRETYKTIGGSPELDGDYTIFGEIVEGISVAEAINSVPTSSTDLPLSLLKFSLRILTKAEIKKLKK